MDDYGKHGEEGWVELIGPFTDAAGVAERLDASPRDVARLTGSGHLRAPVTADEATVHPWFQFTELDWRTFGVFLWAAGCHRGAPFRDWKIAAWLGTPNPLLVGRTPLALIRPGGADGVLLRLVASEAARFTEEPVSEGVDGGVRVRV